MATGAHFNLTVISYGGFALAAIATTSDDASLQKILDGIAPEKFATISDTPDDARKHLAVLLREAADYVEGTTP